AMAAPHPPGGDVFYYRAVRPNDLGAWWKDSEIVRQLQLSDAQVSQIEQTFLNARLKLIDLNADAQRQETLLQPLVDADQMDEAKISAQIDQVLAARTRLEKSNMMLMFDIRKVLTVEQWKKLRDLQQARQRLHIGTPLGGPPRMPGLAPPPPGGPQTPSPGDDDL
ncbi:MAG TPA: periplasmic heavy metal sensor, partial [Terriglobales bacterium]|nr:periplasmic heavy metal sensor [Terriglobales bacterium]